MKFEYLDRINSPEDLKALDKEHLPELCREIREFLIQSVSKTGGHLASNLGAVELTVAMHRMFSSPKDCIMLDVGHQSYVHKILTGRKDAFGSLRQFGGISGFLRPSESEHDCFVSGHASNSISAALGMARAKKQLQAPGHVVCMIGDGALTGGMAYEALNDAGQSRLPLIVVFNDNEMSISKNVGAMSKRLASIRVRPGYFRFKSGLKKGLSKLPKGAKITSFAGEVKNWMKNALLKETLFELLGFYYMGPVDGNDIDAVCMLLEEAKRRNQPVVVHCKTIKGKGYAPAEQLPNVFHGVSAFDVESGQPLKAKGKDFSAAFGEALCRLAEEDSRICAVTAAMSEGTGLVEYADRYPKRFFDVGIAEEHAVTMAAGMASQGAIPVCAIYSTFLQRGYDQLLHDVAIAGNHVVFGIDRAGLVGADGETHQGIFDVPYLMTVPGMKVLSPSSFAELDSALRYSTLSCTGPVAIRYPRGGEGTYREDTMDRPFLNLRQGSRCVVITYGMLINDALSAVETLQEKGLDIGVIKVNDLCAFLDMAEKALEPYSAVVVLEDCIEHGSLGQALAARYGTARDFKLLNLGAQFIPEGSVDQLKHAYHIDAKAVVSTVEALYV